jgi:nucleotide exchange factor SIL1
MIHLRFLSLFPYFRITCLQNNPIAQSLSQTHNLIPILLKFLSIESNAHVSSRFLYALSSIVRGSSSAIDSLARHHGLSILMDAYTSSTNEDFKAKCALFITDLVDPNMTAAEKIVYVEQGGGMDAVLETGVLSSWCKAFQNTLFGAKSESTGHMKFDTREKVLGGLIMIKKRFPENCDAEDGLEAWLNGQKIVATEEELDEYYIVIEKAKKLFRLVK